MPIRSLIRRCHPVAQAAVLAIAMTPLSACARHNGWHATVVDGALPALDFAMTRATDAKSVTEADYRGKVVLLYFGYTYCPDVCPMTLSNIGRVLRALGPRADGVRVLFVTVDPARDALPVLRQYAAAFAPQVVGLRGSPDQLAALARRYRVAYSVDPHGASDGGYQVTHGSGVYVFDADGKARLLNSTLSTDRPDIAGATADIARLLG